MKTILLFLFFGFFTYIIKNNDIEQNNYDDEDEEEEFDVEDLSIHINNVLNYLNYKNKTEFTKKEFELIMKTLFIYEEKEIKEDNIEIKKK